MADRILVKVARLGDKVVEVYLPDDEEATVLAALEAAGIELTADEEIRIGGQPADFFDILLEGDVITLVPRIKED